MNNYSDRKIKKYNQRVQWPVALGWLGSVRGHRVEALGVEHFGQTGSIGELYRHHGIDANAILDAAESLTVGAPVRHRKMAV
jgi:pyruvate dehydrogenase E1 component